VLNGDAMPLLDGQGARDALEKADAADADGIVGKITALQRIRGIGENFAAVLTREVFYRSFDNPPAARQLCRDHTHALPERRHGP